MSIEDYAQQQELMRWELNNQSRPDPVRYEPGQPGYGPEFCVLCDEDMPAARREHGFKICVSCKSAQEADDRHYYRHCP